MANSTYPLRLEDSSAYVAKGISDLVDKVTVDKSVVALSSALKGYFSHGPLVLLASGADIRVSQFLSATAYADKVAGAFGTKVEDLFASLQYGKVVDRLLADHSKKVVAGLSANDLIQFAYADKPIYPPTITPVIRSLEPQKVINWVRDMLEGESSSALLTSLIMASFARTGIGVTALLADADTESIALRAEREFEQWKRQQMGASMRRLAESATLEDFVGAQIVHEEVFPPPTEVKGSLTTAIFSVTEAVAPHVERIIRTIYFS